MSELLGKKEQKELLAIARGAIVSHITSGDGLTIEPSSETLRASHGCFVTIKQEGKLRGCIGNFISDKSLHLLVREMAVAAAIQDPRFYPMKEPDLENSCLEISVLSPLQKVESIDSIIIGKHGLYIIKNSSHGVLLPQVAAEFGWNREEFLKHTCLKAGLPENAWQKECDIFNFSAQVFSE